jgi:hypothetical protein
VKAVADRAVSTALGYVLGLAIVAAMMTGLFVVSGEIVSDERERAIRSELRVLGNQLAADVASVDRLARSADDGSAGLTQDLPDTVAGSGYQIRLVDEGAPPATLELTTDDPDVTVNVTVMNGTAVGDSVVPGGDATVYYDGSEIVLIEGFVDAIERGDLLQPPYDTEENITTADDAPGVTTSHVVSLNVTGNAVGNSLNQVTVDYLSGDTNVSETAAGDDLDNLRAMGLDTDGDGRIETNVMDDVETSDFEAQDDGSTLVIELTGNYNLAAGDELIVVYDAVVNPSTPGTYDVDIDLNGDRVYDGSIAIE